MSENFTQNDLVRFLYRDGNTLELLEIEAAVEESPGLRRRIKMLSKAKKMLPKVLFAPSESSLYRILAYSQAGLTSM
jgi:hypothetical protein